MFCGARASSPAIKKQSVKLIFSEAQCSAKPLRWQGRAPCGVPCGEHRRLPLIGSASAGDPPTGSGVSVSYVVRLSACRAGRATRLAFLLFTPAAVAGGDEGGCAGRWLARSRGDFVAQTSDPGRGGCSRRGIGAPSDWRRCRACLSRALRVAGGRWLAVRRRFTSKNPKETPNYRLLFRLQKV